MSDIKVEYLTNSSVKASSDQEVKQLFVSELLVITQEGNDSVLDEGKELVETKKVATSMKDILEGKMNGSFELSPNNHSQSLCRHSWHFACHGIEDICWEASIALR